MKLKNKYAIVTGASTGIGRSIAIELAKEGAYVVLTARRKKALENTKKEIIKLDGSATVVPSDLANANSILGFTESITAETEKIDILVNVAGIWHGEDQVYAELDFDKFSPQIVQDTLNVGTIAPMLLAHAFMPLMPKNSKIINISGTFENGAKGWLPYYVSKKAIEDFTVGLAEETEARKIQVNCISPSDTATQEYKKYFPEYFNEGISPSKIAQQAVYLCSSEADSITGTIWVMKKDKAPYKGFHT